MSGVLFVAGTGTDVGKTYVSALLVKQLLHHHQSVAYYKAAMSGNSCDAQGVPIPGDALAVQSISGLQQPLSTMCPYVYCAPVSPHLAAQWEGNPLQLERIRQDLSQLTQNYEWIVMEGAGGILCPLALQSDGSPLLQSQLIQVLGLPCVLVADGGLGTINHTGLTAWYLQSHGIPLRGLILNCFDRENPLHRDNLILCETITGVSVLDCIPQGATCCNLSLQDFQGLYGKGEPNL